MADEYTRLEERWNEIAKMIDGATPAQRAQMRETWESALQNLHPRPAILSGVAGLDAAGWPLRDGPEGA